MSNIEISPSVLSGRVSPPPSKSAAHRAVLCAALSDGISTLRHIDLSKDIQATIDCVQALGAKTSLDGDVLTVDGRSSFCMDSAVFDCGESGSTLRFLIPLAAALGVRSRFTGQGRLPMRPIGIYLDCLPKAGVECKSYGGLPLEIHGQLRSGTFEIPGNISSQFITGFLLALPLLKGDSKIMLTSPLESSGYIDMTMDIMEAFGVYVNAVENGFEISGGQSYKPRNYTIEGDWSQAAFYLSAAALGGNIELEGMNLNSKQGDRACLELFEHFGCEIGIDDGIIRAQGKNLHGININAKNIPDLVPTLACTAALCQGTTTIANARRLRLKESDRLKAISEGLSALGVDIEEKPDGLVIHGRDNLSEGFAKGYNDHRIVMALSIAALRASGSVTISDMESINKSYPNFFKDYVNLGGKVNVHMG